ncbi:hypothetical protein ABFS83_01G052100 [Erythranthe nasuta]
MLIDGLFLIFSIIRTLSYIRRSSNNANLSFILTIAFCKLLIMGNCQNNPLPVDTFFGFPTALPTWPTGGGFGSGEMDLGGLQIRKVSTFKKIWTSYQSGMNNFGATFFEPDPIPDGFSMLGSYAQTNDQPLFGWNFVGKSDGTDILKQPTDYTLVWSDTSTTESAYFWLPIPPDGYKAVGFVITTTADKPSLDKIRCVRSDFTDESEIEAWIWGQGGMNVYGSRPKTRGTNAQQLSVGAFLVQTDNYTDTLPCLKNNNSTVSAAPNLSQIKAVFNTYSPYIYFFSKENYLPSSVNWFFSNGALLYKKDDESNPVGIEADGSNLPQGGSNDGAYWIDLPGGKNERRRVQGGDLQSAEAYLHSKAVLGGAFTDIQVWLFYPFNGHATAKLGIIHEISLGKIGEHVGDWEHVTLRISNFDGVLYRVYFAAHAGGTWVDASLLEYVGGGGAANKFVGYASHNGHAAYFQAGEYVQGPGEVGIRNDTGKSDMVMDTGASFTVVAADGLSAAEGVVEPAWLEYAREWGPKISYDFGKEVKKLERWLPGKLKSLFKKLVEKLPEEVYGEEGPTGPKMKSSWDGDEI